MHYAEHSFIYPAIWNAPNIYLQRKQNQRRKHNKYLPDYRWPTHFSLVFPVSIRTFLPRLTCFLVTLPQSLLTILEFHDLTSSRRFVHRNGTLNFLDRSLKDFCYFVRCSFQRAINEPVTLRVSHVSLFNPEGSSPSPLRCKSLWISLRSSSFPDGHARVSSLVRCV